MNKLIIYQFMLRIGDYDAEVHLNPSGIIDVEIVDRYQQKYYHKSFYSDGELLSSDGSLPDKEIEDKIYETILKIFNIEVENESK